MLRKGSSGSSIAYLLAAVTGHQASPSLLASPKDDGLTAIFSSFCPFRIPETD